MRIGWKERRILQRRLKNRLPPTFPLQLPCIGIAITASVVIDPRALALIAEGRATPELAPVIVEKNWEKGELGQSIPGNPILGIDERVADELTAILLRMAKNQATEKSRQTQQGLVTVQPSKNDYMFRLASLKDAPQTRTAEGPAILGYMGGEGQKAGSDHIKENVQLINQVQKGLSFNLDFSSIFQRKSKNARPSGQLRYGLVLKDIKPDPRAPKRAAIGDMSDDLIYAGHAKVEWTIGPLDEERGRVIYKGAMNLDSSDSNPKASIWYYIPKPSFRVHFKPELGNLTGLNGQNLPKWTIELHQDEGYYTLVYQTKTTGERIAQEHRFKIPIYRQMNIGRRFNDKWQVIETNASNILIDKQLPIVSVHQMHLEQRYKVEAAQNIGRHRLGFAHQSEAMNPQIVIENQRPESYSLKYETEF